LVRKVDFRLDASRARRRVTGGEHVRKAEAREANVLVVEVRHVGAGKILAVHADVDEDARGAGQLLGSLNDMRMRSGNATEETSPSYCVTWPLEKVSWRARGSIETNS